MNNLLSYCGSVDAKIRASDKDLPVQTITNSKIVFLRLNKNTYLLFGTYCMAYLTTTATQLKYKLIALQS